MNTKADIDAFFSQPALAVVGVSRNTQKFGSMAYQELKQRGIKVYPVHPVMEQLGSERCYPNVASLPKEVGGVVVVIPPAKAEQVVKEAHDAGIRHIFLQSGSESPAAIEFCKQNGISLISGHCIMMFPNARGMHKPHRWVLALLGKLPK
jgi:predicted CoA-binding protein